MKNNKRVAKRILQKEPTQSKQSETTITSSGPDLMDHALNMIHPVLGYAGDILQSSGKPYSKMEAKQSNGLGQTIVEQVKSVNQSVEEIIKQNVKVPNQLMSSMSEQKFRPFPRPELRSNRRPEPKIGSVSTQRVRCQPIQNSDRIRGHTYAQSSPTCGCPYGPQVKFAAYPDMKTKTQPKEVNPVLYQQMEPIDSMMPPPPILEDDSNNPYASLPDQS